MEIATEFSALGRAFQKALEDSRHSLPDYHVTKPSNNSSGTFNFPGKHLQPGEVIVFDDEEELTAYFGEITHIHLADYAQGVSADERIAATVKLTLDTLRDFFTERAEVGVMPNGVGQYGPRGTCSGDVFLWSGPLNKT